MPGPVPKRSDQRRRRNEPKIPLVQAPAGKPVKAPPASRDWHPIAREFYLSLAKSGQAAFYQASDWAAARYLAEVMSRELLPKVVGTNDDGPVIAPGPINGASVSAHCKFMTGLLVTEGDRRRVSVELLKAGAEAETAPAEKSRNRDGALLEVV